jgi:hypothetical protein
VKILIVDDGNRSLEPVLALLRVVQFRPDIVLIDTDSPSRRTFDQGVRLIAPVLHFFYGFAR